MRRTIAHVFLRIARDTPTPLCVCTGAASLLITSAVYTFAIFGRIAEPYADMRDYLRSTLAGWPETVLLTPCHLPVVVIGAAVAVLAVRSGIRGARLRFWPLRAACLVPFAWLPLTLLHAALVWLGAMQSWSFNWTQAGYAPPGWLTFPLIAIIGHPITIPAMLVSMLIATHSAVEAAATICPSSLMSFALDRNAPGSPCSGDITPSNQTKARIRPPAASDHPTTCPCSLMPNASDQAPPSVPSGSI